MENIIGLLPCAGTASRLHNLPNLNIFISRTKTVYLSFIYINCLSQLL